MKKNLLIILLFFLYFVFFGNIKSAGSDDFIMKIDTSLGDGQPSFLIPIHNQARKPYNYNVDCDNDGVFEATGQTGSYTCTYSTGGIYEIRIEDNVGDGTGFNGILFDGQVDAPKLISVEQWGTLKWTTFSYSFSGATNLTSVASSAGGYGSGDDPDFSAIASDGSIGRMFMNATSFDSNLSSWVLPARSARGMFGFATSFNNGGAPLTWTTTGIFSMEEMFRGATSFNQDISSWDVSSVTNFSRFMEGATSFNSPIFNVGPATTNLSSMFLGATAFNQPINNWDVSSVTNFDGLFRNSSFNQDISSWNTSSATSMYAAFAGNTSFNQDISSWDVSSVTNFSRFMEGATSFNSPIFNVGPATTNISSMFRNASSFNQPINNWDVSNITSLYRVFNGATSFNQPLDNWDVSKVTNMTEIFAGASSFNQNINNWDTSSVENMYRIFFNASSFNQPLNNWNTSKVTNFNGLFRNANSFNQDISNFDFSLATNTTNILDGTSMNVFNYDNLLSSLSQQSLQLNLTFGVSGLKYCNSENSRQNVIDNFNWNFSGDVKECPYEISVNKISDGSEPSTDIVFRISLDRANATGSSISGDINYSGAATEGVDYVAVNNFSINNGSDFIDINLSIIDDNLAELNESVILTISNISFNNIIINNDNATALINDDNDGVVIVTNNNLNISENQTFVTDIDATDSGAPPLTFSISGTDASLFNINSSTGEISFKAAPDFENPTDSNADNVYTFEVRVENSNGDFDTQTFNLTINNINEAPKILTNNGNSYNFNLTEGLTEVLTIEANDPENDTLIYTLSGNDASLFSIDSNGKITLNNPLFFDNPQDSDLNNIYNLTVRVEDSGGLFSEIDLNIEIKKKEEEKVVSKKTAGKSKVISSRLNKKERIYTCRDPRALNYVDYGYNDLDKCKYNNNDDNDEEENKKIENNQIMNNFERENKKNGKNFKCPYFKGYYKIGNKNEEIKKIKAFLKERGYYQGEINNYFDKETFKAVKEFQVDYSDKILKPWGINEATGYWYKTSRKTANELMGCYDFVNLNKDLNDEERKKIINELYRRINELKIRLEELKK